MALSGENSQFRMSILIKVLAVKKSKSAGKETPLMKQYNAIKAKHPDAMLLFRVGDFYETFGEDAIKAAAVLGIVLTKRHNGSAGEVELAGFPHHSLDNYLPKLVRSGLRVAVCDQLEDPKMAKKIVKRGVTELVTPGVTFNEDVLDKKENNFLAAIHFDRKKIGVSFLDVSTGEFFVGQGDQEQIDKLLQNFRPSEIIYQKQKRKLFHDLTREAFYSFPLDDWAFSSDFAEERLKEHFGTSGLKGFGIDAMPEAVAAAGAILEYLRITQNDNLEHIKKIQRIESDDYVWLDRFTIRNLELVSSPNVGAITLIDILDQCHSPMGSRMMRRWLIWPLKNREALLRRHEIVRVFSEKEGLKSDLIEQISNLGDLERLLSKIAVSKINPREILRLKDSLKALEVIVEKIKASGLKELKTYLD